MKLHPRYYVVEQAEQEFSRAMAEIETKHNLTYGEVVKLLGNYLANCAKYMIREERHPNDPGKRGDEE